MRIVPPLDVAKQRAQRCAAVDESVTREQPPAGTQPQSSLSICTDAEGPSILKADHTAPF